VRAVVLEAPGPIESGPLRVLDRDDPRPGPGQVVIRVAACGVCRSNLHMIEGDWVGHGVPAFVPIVPGHEVVGRVIEVGSGVEGLERGARVGIQPLWSTCGRCRYCLSGRDQLCRLKEITGETVDGGYAQLLLATAAHVHVVPDELDDVEAAPLFCPGVTAYNAVEKAELRPGMRVGVFGIGGVGHMVLQFSALAGAEVWAVARGRAHLALAEELGAHPVDDSSGRGLAALRAAGGVDAAIVFAPSDEVLRRAIEATNAGGTIVLGVHAQVGALPFFDEKRVVGSVIGSRRQMRDVLSLAAAGKVRAHCETFPLSAATEALARLKRGDIQARAVLVPEHE
jgi:propanol-preferring alcohol dehydrogenase